MLCLLSADRWHNKIFSIAAYLSKAGHFVKVCITNPTLDFVIQRKAAEFIQRNFRCSGFGVTIGVDSIHSCDALVATQWSTAYVVGSLRKRAAKLFYFVQDYEPLFYPMGSEYLKAANTYMMGLHHISIGQWCAEQLRTRHHAKVDGFLRSTGVSIISGKDYRPVKESELYFSPGLICRGAVSTSG